MGMLIQNNLLQLTDGSNNVKFTTAHRMPHILGQISGIINVPNMPISLTQYIDTNPDSSNYGFHYFDTPFLTDNTTNHYIAYDPSMAGGEVFSQAFFTISAGDAHAGGASITGNGSTLLRVFRESQGAFCGSIIVTCGPAPGASELIVLQVRSAAHAIDFSGYTPSYAGNTGIGVLLGSGLTINYRVYYGRFT